MKRVGLIRVLTTSDADLLALHGKLIEQTYPSLQVTSRCIADHPEGVHDASTAESAAPLVVALASDFQSEGFDAVVVSCAGDPGVREARRLLEIPVIGAGESAAGVALTLGEKIGVLAISDEVPSRMVKVLGEAMVCSTKPVGVETTLDLMTEEGRVAVEQAATRLQAEGIDVIVLACTGMSTVGAAKWISEKTGLRVIDPVEAEGLIALYLTNR